jgi:hypothetical protein
VTFRSYFLRGRQQDQEEKKRMEKTLTFRIPPPWKRSQTPLTVQGVSPPGKVQDGSNSPLKKSIGAGRSKSARCKAREILRNEAYFRGTLSDEG